MADYDVPWEVNRLYCLRKGCGHHELVHDLNGCKGDLGHCKCPSFIQPSDEALKEAYDRKRRERLGRDKP